MKEYFREICDDQLVHDNLSIKHKSIRIFVRYLLRICGLQTSVKVLTFVLRLIPKHNDSYWIYLIRINFFRLSYLLNLSENSYKEAHIVKKKWAKNVIHSSLSKNQKESAENYLETIEALNNNNLLNNTAALSKEKFYLYGPNASIMPNEIYSDYTLVHIKPFPEELKSFKKEILFLNSYYFNNSVKDNYNYINKLKKRYHKIYVTCMTSILPDGFHRVVLNKPGYIASEMALQRILGFLLQKHQSFECVIDGFDFYLNNDAYSNPNYHKLTRLKNSLIQEKEMCLSLADHDFLFNFILTKKLLCKLKLNDSVDFKKIITLTSDEYQKRLFTSRKFSTLKRIN
mgnify:CR=1 FL=1|tara:strand:- start:23266 stop:24294 length:1029 start_codon:yes stop_codon:yes gene_type:complete